MNGDVFWIEYRDRVPSSGYIGDVTHRREFDSAAERDGFARLGNVHTRAKGQHPGHSTWTTNADGSAVCPHRDLTVCTDCRYHPDVVEVGGAFFILSADEQAALREALST